MAISELVVGVVLGAVPTYFFTQYSVRNAELSSRIDDLCADVRAFGDHGCRYWQLLSDDPQLDAVETTIRGLSSRIGKMIALLSEHYWIFQFASEDELIKLRRLITSGGFEEEGRNPDQSRCQDIQEAAQDLEVALRRSRWSIW